MAELIALLPLFKAGLVTLVAQLVKTYLLRDPKITGLVGVALGVLLEVLGAAGVTPATIGSGALTGAAGVGVFELIKRMGSDGKK